MKTFKNFMVEGPSDLAPNPGIVKAIKKDKEEAKRRKQEMIATREKNLKNYQQGKVRANWVKEEVEQIEESYTLKLTKTTKPHTTDDEDNPVPAIEKHYDIHHKGKKVSYRRPLTLAQQQAVSQQQALAQSQSGGMFAGFGALLKEALVPLGLLAASQVYGKKYRTRKNRRN